MEEQRQTQIILGNATSRIEGFVPPQLGEVLGAVVQQYRMKKLGPGRTISERYSELITLYQPFGSYYPTGLTNRVVEHTKKYGSKITIVDERKPIIKEPYKVFKEIKVREQIAAGVDIAFDNKRGIFAYCTGAGKTRWATKFIQKTGANTLYVVPSVGVLNQTLTELREYLNTSIGLVGDGEADYIFTDTNRYLPNVLLITVQSLWSIFKNNPELFAYFVSFYESIIFDEAHHITYKPNKEGEIPFNTWFIIAQKFVNALWRVGLTATPGVKGDLGRLMLEGATGKVQSEYTRLQAEADGVVCPFNCRIFEVECTQTSTWQSAYKVNITKNSDHHKLVAKIARDLVKEGRKVIVIFDEVESHIRPIAEILTEAEVLTGDDSGSVRQEVTKRFEAGITPIILTTVISEGVNIPAIDAIILAAGKGSKEKVERNVSQRVGRGSRFSNGKDDLILVDFYHKNNRFLQSHSKNRIKVLKDLGGKIEYYDADTLKPLENLHGNLA